MKFTANTKTLLTELEYASRIAGIFKTIPICNNVRIDADDNGVTFTGTDLDTWIIARAETSVTQHGSTTVDAKLLQKAIKSLNGNATFELADKLLITSGNSKIALDVNNADNFPLTPEVTAPISLTLNNEIWQQMVKDCLFAITKDVSRFRPAGAKIESGDTTRLIATDGHRLSFTETDTRGKFDALLRRTALVESVRMPGDVEFSKSGDYVQMTLGNRTIISRELSGNFPNYDLVMPKDHPYSLTFDMADMAKALKNVEPFASPRSKAVTVDVYPTETSLTAESGGCSRTDTILSTLDGENVTLGFNASYLLDFCKVCPGGIGTMTFKDASAPMEWTLLEHPVTFKYIVCHYDHKTRSEAFYGQMQDYLDKLCISRRLLWD